MLWGPFTGPPSPLVYMISTFVFVRMNTVAQSVIFFSSILKEGQSMVGGKDFFFFFKKKGPSVCLCLCTCVCGGGTAMQDF